MIVNFQIEVFLSNDHLRGGTLLGQYGYSIKLHCFKVHRVDTRCDLVMVANQHWILNVEYTKLKI